MSAYRAIFEGKNEIGSGGCDPSIHGTLYYHAYWSQLEAKKVRDSCCCPSFIIAIAGPWLCVLGAVYLNKVVVEPLTDFISLAVKPQDDRHLLKIARLFEALRRAFDQLSTFNRSLHLGRCEQRFFPYLREYPSGNDAINHLIYDSLLTDDRARLVWKAKTEDDRIVVVKFTKRYHAVAHDLCAKNKFAPHLLYVSEENPTGYMMIVMEYVDGMELKPHLVNSLRNRQTIYRDVEHAVKLLHGRDIVFADLCYPNILVTESDGQQHAMLVDFDWCGEDGVGRYPLSMSRSLSWPDGAQPGAFLSKEHDMYWLKKLKRAFELE